MDITLERILSLLPRKPDGKYVHGAKAEFARSIGLKGGESVTMWENGTSDSYKVHLYEISAVHGVSVEWLKGETDEKTKKAAPTVGDDFIDKFIQLTPQNQELVKQMIEQLAKTQPEP